MIITRLKLKNWRNFLEADIPLIDRVYILGANATGKSNLLDVFRFLRDVSKREGGGLRKAVADRGGISKLRCLHARSSPDVRIEVHISNSASDTEPVWIYVLAFKGDKQHEVLVSAEYVEGNGECLVDRPVAEDREDPVRLTQTYLEQIQTNERFRQIGEILSKTTYLHLVPQLIKNADRIGGQRLEDDPFGQGFLERVAKAPEATRTRRLNKIAQALRVAVPQFHELKFTKDEATGRPHLEALYVHHRPKAGWQKEDQFSDGTLRLLSLLWLLLEGDSLLLLEEPELSLNDGIVAQIPRMLQYMQKGVRRQRQIIISTHSEALLSNPGIDGKGVLILQPAAEGSSVRTIDDVEGKALSSGMSVAEVVLPKTRPEGIKQLSLF